MNKQTRRRQKQRQRPSNLLLKKPPRPSLTRPLIEEMLRQHDYSFEICHFSYRQRSSQGEDAFYIDPAHSINICLGVDPQGQIEHCRVTGLS